MITNKLVAEFSQNFGKTGFKQLIRLGRDPNPETGIFITG